MRFFETLEREEKQSINNFKQKRKFENSKSFQRVITEAKNIDVIETFVLDFYIKPKLKTKNLYIVDLKNNNYALYNYETKIAERKFYGVNIEVQWEILIDSTRFSSTTTSIQNAVKATCKSGRVPYKEVRFSENESVDNNVKVNESKHTILRDSLKRFNESRKTEDKETIVEGYVGKEGEKVFVSKKDKGFVLINKDNSDLIDMEFDSEDKATDYAKKKKLVIVKESFDPKERFWWVAIGLDGNNRKANLYYFKKEKQADKVVDFYENISDITIFFVDYYGFTTIDKVEKEYKTSQVYDGLWVAQKPERYVNSIYQTLKESSQNKKLEIKEAISHEALNKYKLASKIDNLVAMHGDFKENEVLIHHSIIKEFSEDDLAEANYKIKSIEQHSVDPLATLVLFEKAGNVDNFGDKKAKPFKKKDDDKNKKDKVKVKESGDLDIEAIKERLNEAKVASKKEDIKFSKTSNGAESADYKLGTILRSEDKKDYSVKLGDGSKSKQNVNAKDLDDAIKKIDNYTAKESNSNPRSFIKEKLDAKQVNSLLSNIKKITIGLSEGAFYSYKGNSFRSVKDIEKFIYKFDKPSEGYDKVNIKIIFKDGQELNHFRYYHGNNDPDFDKQLKGHLSNNLSLESVDNTRNSIREEVDGILGANNSASWTGAIDFITSSTDKISRGAVSNYLQKHFGTDPLEARLSIANYAKATSWLNVANKILNDTKIPSTQTVLAYESKSKEIKESYRHNAMDDLVEDLFKGDYQKAVEELVKQMRDSEFAEALDYIASMNDFEINSKSYRGRMKGLDLLSNYMNYEQIYSEVVLEMNDNEFKSAENAIRRMWESSKEIKKSVIKESSEFEMTRLGMRI